MAVCKYCKRDMKTSFSCSVKSIADGDRAYPRQMVDRLETRDGRCADCGAAEGNFHHLGCDQEKCPKCGGQLISCGCFDHVFEEEGEGE